MTVAMRLDELTKSYGDTPALTPTSLSVSEGERVAVIGHNGSGKTTMMKMIVGLLDPTGGGATVFGHPAGSEAARRACSWLSDTPNFYDDLSLAEHLEYVAGLHGASDGWGERAAELMARFDLADRRDDLPVTFSRGLRQKAAICIALIRPMQLLLVDEPFVGLDTAGKDALLTTFDSLAADGVTLVVATHELSFIDRVGRVIALRDGKVIHDGAVDDTDVRALTDR